MGVRISRVAASALLLAGSCEIAHAQNSADADSVSLHGRIHTRGVRILPAETATPVVSNAGDVAPAVSAVSAPAPLRTAALPAPVIKSCARPIADPDLHVDAAADFQRQLRPRLRMRQRVVLDLSAPYAAQAAPPAGLAPWIDAVKGSGGSVSVAQYCQMTRGFGDWLARMFATTPRDPSRAYDAAHGYDMILHADALDRTVTQVEFVPRAGRAL